MALIISNGALVNLKTAGAFPHRSVPTYVGAGGALTLQYGVGDHATFTRLYEQQDSVRSVIGYLARTAASIGIHAYARVSDTDRERLSRHPAVKVLQAPLPGMSYYDLVERVFIDHAVYGEAYLIKVKNSSSVVGLKPLTPSRLSVFGHDDIVTGYEYQTPDGTVVPFTPEQIIALRDYNPETPLRGLSRLESLRLLLSAEAEALKARAASFANGGRLSAVIERSSETEMTPEQLNAFAEQWRTRFTGAQSAGKVAMLEPGMSIKALDAATSQEAQFAEVRRLTKTETWEAFGLMEGMVKTSTDVVREVLGPWFAKFVGVLTHSLLPDMSHSDDVYLEANLEARMAGDMLQQADAMRRLVGAPVLTRNEARARMNMPAVEGGDELIVPLYLAEGHPDTGTPDGGRKNQD